MLAKDFCKTVTDGTHDSPKKVVKGHFLITSKHIKTNEIDYSKAYKISEEDYQKVIKRSPVEKFDILYSMIGTVGIPFLIKDDNPNFACKNMGIFKFEGNEENALWMYYYLQSPSAKEYLYSHLSGSTQQYITLDSLRNFPIYVPHVSLRNKIVRILKSIDDKIELNNQINKNLELQVRAVFSHLFADNESVTPATIADISLNVTDGVHNTVNDDPEGEYLLLSCKNIKGGALSIGANDRRINSETFEKLRRRTKLAKGDVLISSVGTVGELLLLNTEPSNYEFQRSVAIIKPNPEIVSPAYLYEALVYKKAELINAAHGAVQQCLFISDIAGFPIGIPTSKDLQKFDDIVIPMFDKITANEAETIRLSALRDTLLIRLMSGEIDVSKLEI